MYKSILRNTLQKNRMSRYQAIEQLEDLRDSPWVHTDGQVNINDLRAWGNVKELFDYAGLQHDEAGNISVDDISGAIEILENRPDQGHDNSHYESAEAKPEGPTEDQLHELQQLYNHVSESGYEHFDVNDLEDGFPGAREFIDSLGIPIDEYDETRVDDVSSFLEAHRDPIEDTEGDDAEPVAPKIDKNTIPSQRDEAVTDYYDNSTAEDFIDTIVNNHHHVSQNPKAVYESRHNTPENCSKIAERLREIETYNTASSMNKVHQVRDLAKHGRMKYDVMEDLTDHMWKIEDANIMSNFLDNPAVDTSLQYKLSEKFPQQFGEVSHLDTVHPEVLNKFVENKEHMKRMPVHSVRQLIKNKVTDGTIAENPRLVRSILDHRPQAAHYGGHIDALLDTLDDNTKNKYMNDWLGMDHYEVYEGQYDAESDEHYSDRNWRNLIDPESGEIGGMNSHSSNWNLLQGIARSRHLNDEQADFIKRHGDIHTKMELYNNEHIDPKHGVEMTQKWMDDDKDHGYSAEELGEYHRYNESDVLSPSDMPSEDYERIMNDLDEDGEVHQLIQDDYYLPREWIRDNLDTVRQQAENYNGSRKRQIDRMLANPDSINNRGSETIMQHLDLNEDYFHSDAFQEHYNNKKLEMFENNEEYLEWKYEQFDNAAHDDRFIPQHLHQHIDNLENMRGEREARVAKGHAGKHGLDHVDVRHAYGDNQHFYEIAKDHADRNGGNVDIGSLHKTYPNQKEIWKKMFGGKGKLTSEELATKLEEIPKQNYNISYGTWKRNGAQNINNRDQLVVRIDHSPDSLKGLQEHENKSVYDTFNHIAKVSKQSGHPTNSKTIGWARVDVSDPDHWMIDEIQSDFSKTTRQYLQKNNASDKADAVGEIVKHHKNWNEALVNHVINMAKKNGASRVSTHTPESKSSHTNSGKVHSVYKDSYGKLARKMGFKVNSPENMPLTEKGRKYFIKEGRNHTMEDMDNHENGYFHHARSWRVLKEFKNNPEHALRDEYNIPNEWSDHHMKHHWDMAEKHLNKYRVAGGHPEDWRVDEESMSSMSMPTAHTTRTLNHINHAGMSDDFFGHESDHAVDKPVREPTPDHELSGQTFDIKNRDLQKSDYTINDLIKMELL